MSRLVENSRLSIGTFKALGYEDSKIMLYYLTHAILVVNIGFILGLLPTKLFTLVIIQTIYGSQDLPSYILVHDMTAIVAAYAVTCAVCLGTAYIVTKNNFGKRRQLVCGQRLRKKPEKTFWSGCRCCGTGSGLRKDMIRNIFRYKTRMAICIVSVASCMALIMTALGIMDSINNYLNILDDKAQKFDLLVTLDSDVTENQYKHLEVLDGVTEVQSAMTTGVKMYTSDIQPHQMFLSSWQVSFFL